MSPHRACMCFFATNLKFSVCCSRALGPLFINPKHNPAKLPVSQRTISASMAKHIRLDVINMLEN